ncbi:alpha-protein kinase vwkA-like [Symsagittifera roscoffensis]|uniref:alpha-protein kinase vwkA-like n=1 Tax=Symsagittifera roscoffensis TaxID=84072 RepID=UPI00307CA3FE
MGLGASSHETLMSANKCVCCNESYWVRFERDYFSQGTCRWAFRGTYHGNGKHAGNKCVTKVFKDNVARHYDSWVPDLLASKEAVRMGKNFNREHPTNRQIQFITPLICKMDKIGDSGGFLWIRDEDERFVRKQEWVAVEPFIEGEYKKFNSNSGAVFGLSEALPAFSHYTYDASDRELVVCDLQGVRSHNYYYLTDPAICSRDELYGPTDIGVTGIAMFFENHICTEICKNFAKPNIDNDYVVKGLQPKRSSSYTFEFSGAERAANRYFRNRKTLPAVSE